jgi:hypothetical protein
MDKLLAAIENYQKRAQAPGPKPEVQERKEVEGPDLNDYMRMAQGKNAGARRTAASELRKFGKDGVATLIFMVGNDESIPVRRAALRSLAAIGPAAREALPHLRNIMNSPMVSEGFGTTMSPQEMQFMMEEGDFRRELKDAIARIEGRAGR